MTTHFNKTMFPAREGRRPRWLGVACATALTVAAVGGLGGWHLREHGNAQISDPARQTAATNDGAAAPIVHEPGRVPYSDIFAAELLYVFVDSGEQAATVQRFGDHANKLRVQAGQRPAPITVLIPDRLDPAAVSYVLELPGVNVVDLRTP